MIPTAPVLQAVHRASQRAAAATRQDMKQGVDSLAAIATLAPLFGFIGTTMGIVRSFRSVNGEKSAALIALNLSISESLWTTVLGLFVGITALWCHRYLSGNLS